MGTILIDKLLQTVVNRKASDLHITVGQPPVIRIDGRLKTLETKVLEPEDTSALMKSDRPSHVRGRVVNWPGASTAFNDAKPSRRNLARPMQIGQAPWGSLSRAGLRDPK